MGLFSRRKPNEPSHNRTNDPLDDWKFYKTSNYPDKQIVLDYMGNYGIEIVKSTSGLFYITHRHCKDFDGFMLLTNYRAKIGSPLMVAVVLDDGTIKDFFTSLNDAYNALETLYRVIRNTPGEDDF